MDDIDEDDRHDHDDVTTCPLGICDGSGWITWREAHGELMGEPCRCGLAYGEARELGWDLGDEDQP